MMRFNNSLLNWPSETINGLGRLHYAWVIVGVLALVQVVGLSVNFAGGVLVNPLSDPDGEFGFSLAEVGASWSLYYLMAAVLSPVAGWLGDRYGGRQLMVAGAVLYAGVLVSVAFISQPWHLFLSFGILRGAVQAIFMVPLMASVSVWFRRRLGLGVGVLWAAGGIGPAIMSPLLGNMVTSLGWETSFLLVGPVAGGFFLILSILFRNRPEDLNLNPYGYSRTDAAEPVKNKALENLRAKVFNQNIRRTTAFWNLPAIHALGCMGHGIVLVFAVPMAVSHGVDLTTAAWMLSIISLVSIPSRIITPVIAERHGTKGIMAAALALQGFSVVYLFWCDDAWEFFVFSVIFGVGFGGEWTGYLVINRQYFGNGPMGTVYGWQMSGAFLGHALISWIAGVIVDLTGSYNTIMALSLITSVAGAAFTLSLDPTSRSLIPHWEQSLPPEARSVRPDTALTAD